LKYQHSAVIYVNSVQVVISNMQKNESMIETARGGGTVGKALRVLDQIASHGQPIRFTELLDKSELPKATLYRIVQTLLSERMLCFEPERHTYSLGVRMVRLAHAAWTQSSLAPVARPYLNALSKKIGSTIHLAQLDGAHVLYVDKLNAERPIEMFSQAGKVGPAYCTGVGKVMLAFLPKPELGAVLPQQSFHRFTKNTFGTEKELRGELDDIRGRGFAFDNEEHEPGIICVALPVMTQNNSAIAAISVTSTTSRTNLDALEKLVPEMRKTAGEIAGEAQSWRFPAEKHLSR
jgi:IclR family transcriptional regulator, KDG regulon repressor